MAKLTLELAKNLACIYSYETGYYSNAASEPITYNEVAYQLEKVYCPKSIKTDASAGSRDIYTGIYIGPVVRVVIANSYQRLNLAITPDGEICGIRLCRFCDLGMKDGDLHAKCSECRKSGNTMKKPFAGIRLPPKQSCE